MPVGGGFHHRSVLLQQAVSWLAPAPTHGVYVDATLGGGGHTQRLLEVIGPHGRVLALDRDPEAVAQGQSLVQRHGPRLTVVRAAFGALARVLEDQELSGQVAGVLFDLGVSSHQLDTPERGFSLRHDGPLDMRMGGAVGGGPSAAELVNTLDAEALAKIFFEFGEERYGRRIARAIVRRRQEAPLATTGALASLVAAAVPGAGRERIHPATRVFQALRIAVNGELEQLAEGLEAAMTALRPGGRVVVISFHSLEDRVVKLRFRAAAAPSLPPVLARLPVADPLPTFRLLTRKPVVPDSSEVTDNPRARSARMRVAEKLPLAGERS